MFERKNNGLNYFAYSELTDKFGNVTINNPSQFISDGPVTEVHLTSDKDVPEGLFYVVYIDTSDNNRVSVKYFDNGKNGTRGWKYL